MGAENPPDDPARDPLERFGDWFAGAAELDPGGAIAMTLATSTAAGAPAARMVLLKGFDHDGFVFYSNYQSRKARELERNPRAALLFYWPALHRQIRIEGRVSRVRPEESDAYFATRPRGAQLGAWASPQSAPIADRETLERLLADAEKRFQGREIPRPRHWGGYRLEPESYEFWEARPNRLHDRLRFRREGDRWVEERLGP